MTTYDRRGFALAYAEAQATRITGTDAERVGYAAALHDYRTGLLAGLEQLFGLRLTFESVPDGMSPVFMAFQSTVRSYLAITGPMDGYLEAGLIHGRLEQAGVHERFLSDLRRIGKSNIESRTAHLDILDTLLNVLLGAKGERVVFDEELHAIGVGTIPPNPDDYEW